jgi:hypothetical protein
VRRAALLLGVLLGAVRCATPAAYIAAPADYAAYRKTRIAPTLEGRLAAADQYLTRFPAGAFQPDVRAYFDRAEPVFYRAKQGSIAGLEDYLRTLPSGPHQNEATGRLGALKATRENRQAELSVEADLTAKLDRAGARRRAVREQLTAWIERFLDPSVWKAPLTEARASLVIPWSLELPSPSCAPLEGPRREGLPEGAARRCAKLLELPYAVSVEGVSEERQATVELVVIQDSAGRPIEASLGGPELFLRLEETFTVRAIRPDDREQRVASKARVAELVRDAFGRTVSRAPGCSRKGAAPVFVELRCQGVGLTARAAMAPGEDDLIILGAE